MLFCFVLLCYVLRVKCVVVGRGCVWEGDGERGLWIRFDWIPLSPPLVVVDELYMIFDVLVDTKLTK